VRGPATPGQRSATRYVKGEFRTQRDCLSRTAPRREFIGRTASSNCRCPEQRRKKIGRVIALLGIRVALGALPRNILARVLSQAALISGVGLVLGVAYDRVGHTRRRRVHDRYHFRLGVRCVSIRWWRCATNYAATTPSAGRLLPSRGESLRLEAPSDNRRRTRRPRCT